MKLQIHSLSDSAFNGYFRSTFIDSRYKNMINNECIKGEEDEY